MKVYAIVCEYGAGAIYEGVEMICKTYKIAESHFLNADFDGRPYRIREMILTDKKWEPPKPKKKLNVGKELVKRTRDFNKNIDNIIPKAPQSRKAETRLSQKKVKK
jgi:hypothetical protein